MSSASFTESYISGPQGTLFYTRTYAPPTQPPKAVVIAVHGFNEHIGRFAHIHPSFAERGITVFAFDQRGFGLTVQKKENGAGKKYAQTSWKEQLEDIEWAVKQGKQVKGCETVPVFLMGHSMVNFSSFKIVTLPGLMVDDREAGYPWLFPLALHLPGHIHHLKPSPLSRV